MLQSIFVLNSLGDIIIEKHYRGVIGRSPCEKFWEEITKATDRAEVLPVIVTPRHYLIHIQRNDLFVLGVVDTETEPLLVIEFLGRFADTLKNYFGDVTEDHIKEHFVTVYELLDEMMDNGLPFTTEPNVLTKLVPPPSIMSNIMHSVSGPSMLQQNLPEGATSSVPWRRFGVKYTNNEIYFDIIEELDTIIDTNAMQVTSEVRGVIKANSRLSGMPDLTLSFTNPRIMEDCSFHPCVRLQRFEAERVLSFIPPDGEFELMTYRVSHTIAPPVSVNPQITFGEGGGKVYITVGTRPNKDCNKPVENVKVTVPFPKAVSSATLSATHGSVEYDEISKVAVWTLGKIPAAKVPTLTGTLAVPSNVPVPESNPNVSVDFKVGMFAISGLKVASLSLFGPEKYKPWKGVRSVTKAGTFQVRC